MSDTSLRFNFDKGRDTASPHMRRIAANATAMGVAQKASALLAVGGYVLLGSAIAGLVGHSVALGAAIGPIIGYLAAVPAVSFAAAAGLGALVVGFLGISAALRTSSAGGSAAAGALASAERRYELAVRAAADAQDRLNDARRTAADRIADYARELAGARLDEEAATLAVARAERRLREARRSGDRMERSEADLAYRQALQTLEEVQARLADVTEEEQRRREAGVEGSDEVQDALRQQADAAYELAAAQRALAQSGGGGVDKAAEAYAKLTPAGRALVDVLRSLRPEWAALRATVQQPLLAGVAGDLQVLVSSWMPMLRVQLAGVAGAWNTAFRSTLQLFATPAWIADTNTALSHTVTFSEALGRSWAPFASGFRHFTVVGSTFLPSLGAWVERIANRFNDWAASARESGKIEGWIRNAIAAGRDFWALLVALGGTIRAVFSAGSGGPGYLSGLVEGAQAMRAFVESTEGQAKLAAFFTTLRDVGGQAIEIIGRLSLVLIEIVGSNAGLASLNDTVSVAGLFFGFLADHLDLVAAALPYIIAGFLLLKTVQIAGTAAAVADVPVRLFQAVAMWRHTAALKANTAAVLGNDVATKRSVVSLVAQKVALIASRAATLVATAAQWLWNIAMMANPVGLIILAIVALIAIFVLLWQKCDWFRNFWIGAWNVIWGAIKFVWDWVKDNWPLLLVIITGPIGWAVGIIIAYWDEIKAGFRAVVNFIVEWVGRFLAPFVAIRDRIREVGIWQTLVDGFKAAINFIIGAWNRLDFSLGPWSIPTWVPFIGGKSFYIPDIFPDIPMLDTGGDIRRDGLAFVHQGERVLPAAQVERGGGGGEQRVVVEFDLRGADEELARLLTKMFRVRGARTFGLAPATRP